MSVIMHVQVFNRYDAYRQLILEDILSSLANLPSSKKNARTYRWNSGYCVVGHSFGRFTSNVSSGFTCVMDYRYDFSYAVMCSDFSKQLVRCCGLYCTGDLAAATIMYAVPELLMACASPSSEVRTDFFKISSVLAPKLISQADKRFPLCAFCAPYSSSANW